jgi:uncharacterized protein (TIGR02001 family)
VSAIAALRWASLRGALASLALAGYALTGASSASAEIGAAASVFTQDRLRGYSLSAGHPVANLDLSYDARGGYYASLSGALVYSNEYHLQPLDVEESMGFATQLRPELTLDIGVHNSNYFQYSSRPSSGYTEAYAGLIGKVISGRLYVSPNYFHSGTWRLYGEIESGFRPAKRLTLSAHAGLLVPLNNGSYGSPSAQVDPNIKTQYDWRIGAAQELGRFTLHLDLSGGGPGKDYYDGNNHDRTALVAGATVLF